MKILALAITAISVSFATASEMRMGGTLRQFLKDLKNADRISHKQLTIISAYLPDAEDIEMGNHDFDNQEFLKTQNGKDLKKYIDQQLGVNKITQRTRTYLGSLLNLDEYVSVTTSTGPTPAEYTDNGNVLYHNKISPCTNNCGGSEIYNGIWGFVKTSQDGKSSREYALQCHSTGLFIIDITDSEDSSKGEGKGMDMVQFIAMPGGRPWRDVTVNGNYAYVAGQAGANLWIINLNSLSSTEPNNSNPISSNDIKDRGYKDYGHTINADDGILYLNTAGSSRGCTLLDLDKDPFNPPKIIDMSGGDCHDSFARKNVQVGNEKKDLLFRSDGRQTDYSIIDITNIRTEKRIDVIGSTILKSSSYAHFNYVDEENQYMYGFDEFNKYDIAVFDVSNMENPKYKNEFQWSGDKSEEDVRVHNGQVNGKYLITAYYSAGLRVFDVSNPMAPKEVGKLETWRDPNMDGTNTKSLNKGFDGAWNVYTFLPSGKMLISDTEGGLFIFKLEGDEECKDDPNFVKTRGAKNQDRQRTCAYINAKVYRRKKWCNKKHRGTPIREICCNTCTSS